MIKLGLKPRPPTPKPESMLLQEAASHNLNDGNLPKATPSLQPQVRDVEEHRSGAHAAGPVL